MKQSLMSWQLIVASTMIIPLSGCVDSADPIQILRNQQTGADCIIPAERDAAFISRGRIDATVADGYLFTPLVQNRAEAISASERLLTITGANVDLSFIDGFFDASETERFREEGGSRFLQEFSGTISAGGVSSFGFEIIPKETVRAIGAKLSFGETTRVLASIEMLGELDGGSVSSRPFSYPIDVCKGCLAINLGSCEELGPDVELGGGNSCRLFQNSAASCCTVGENNLVCQEGFGNTSSMLSVP